MKVSTKKFFIIGITTVAVLVFGIVLFRSVYYAPTDEIPTEALTVNALDASSAAQSHTSTLPVRLNIPKINVDAKIQQVGITTRGNMATPNNFIDAGWYKFGTLPGEKGSAVIAGHVNNGLALPAVFSKLNTLHKGDDIYVRTENGGTLHFVVTGSKVYDFNAKVDEVFHQSDGRLLKLITCTGTWIPAYRTHDKRMVVSATLVD